MTHLFNDTIPSIGGDTLWASGKLPKRLKLQRGGAFDL